MTAQRPYRCAPEPPPADDPVPYLERQARETFTVGLGVLLDGIEAAVARGSDSPLSG
ncbi:hypothetical protein OG930_25830 [Streptomyces sp. NBC_01799]|uniref:hypothetical protein n=1 Tax=Streptomyces sp. NBC_01800 TaxID=2975945 RepID=UPI002DDBEE05|nr:hypothetical protein [Streptomyces sp. NBC_01800]WSA74151.1 hypothetical protein OIE65_26610 [Streptomyces sp. NBC_01800]WSA82665.1 hypothetical protein OG930_25830 [Streptomyces sp. NBC_01799]